LSRREKIRLEEQLKKKKKIRWGRIIALILVIVGIILTYKYDLIPKAILLIKPILIQNIEISSEKVQIELGESINISSKIYPENYSKSELTWHSSNDEILEVDNGAVTGKSVGKANIYLADGETKSNELEIECLVSINEVIVNNLVSEIKLGEIYTLETTVLPENATYKELTYESSNTDIITVNDNGSLIANAIGKTTIVIKNYKDEILTSFDIEVKKIPVENITLDDKEVTLGKGQTYIINSKVTPLEATYTDVEWQTSDKNIVKIENRQITAVDIGTATITAITDEGDKKATCKIKVESSAPNNSKKFANGKYNIRTGGSTDYKILATTSKYEEIEILQDSKNGWKKVRNSKRNCRIYINKI